MDGDIDALELDSYDSDDEWTRNFEALVDAREERTDTKRRRMESPRQEEDSSMQWTTNVRTLRVTSQTASGVILDGRDSWTNTSCVWGNGTPSVC